MREQKVIDFSSSQVYIWHNASSLDALLPILGDGSLATNKRATHTETLYESLPSIASLDPQTDFADIMYYGHYSIKRFILDTNTTYPRVLATYNEKGEWTSTYTFGNGVLGMNTPQGTETFFTDGRGSVSEAINRNNRAITTYTYDAFGNVKVQGNSTNHLTYNQEWFDFSTGLQFLRARYVDLELGRFVSRDTVLGTLHDPRTHNLYLYLQNDPLNNIDPSGHRLVNGGSGGPIGPQQPNCNRCNNGTNIQPIIALVCLECGRRRPNVPSPPPSTNVPPRSPTPTPPSGGSNANQNAGAANNAGNKKNSNDVPRDDMSVPARGATAQTTRALPPREGTITTTFERRAFHGFAYGGRLAVSHVYVGSVRFEITWTLNESTLSYRLILAYTRSGNGYMGIVLSGRMARGSDVTIWDDRRGVLRDVTVRMSDSFARGGTWVERFSVVVTTRAAGGQPIGPSVDIFAPTITLRNPFLF